MTAMDLFWIVAVLANVVVWTWLGYSVGHAAGRAERPGDRYRWHEERQKEGFTLYTCIRIRSPIHTKGGEH